MTRKEPIRVFFPILNINLIKKENKGRAIIYQWVNLINNKLYIGSASNGYNRIYNYLAPSSLNRKLPIHNSLKFYNYNNFCLAILDDLGPTLKINKEQLLKKEQFYLNIIFKNNKKQILNLSSTAGSTLGYKHSLKFKLNRTGKLNPMFGKNFSQEFLAMQTKDKTGINNPMFGKQKSQTTIKKLQKMVYVYNIENKKLIGTYPTVECSKFFKIGKDTLRKYINTNIPFKGKIFSHTKLF